MKDPFIQIAEGFRIGAVVFAVLGLGSFLVLVIQELRSTQAEADETDAELAERPCSVCGKPVAQCRHDLKADPDQATLHAREFRARFTEHSLVNPTFPQTHNPQTR